MNLKVIEDKRNWVETELIGCGARRYFDENKDNYVICADSHDKPYAGLAEWPEFNGFYFDTKEETDKAVEQIGWGQILEVMYAQKKKDIPVKEALEKIAGMHQKIMEIEDSPFVPNDALTLDLMRHIYILCMDEEPLLKEKERIHFAKILQTALRGFIRPKAWGNEYILEDFIEGWKKWETGESLILTKPFTYCMRVLNDIWKSEYSSDSQEVASDLALLAKSLDLTMQDILTAFEDLYLLSKAKVSEE